MIAVAALLSDRASARLAALAASDPTSAVVAPAGRCSGSVAGAGVSDVAGVSGPVGESGVSVLPPPLPEPFFWWPPSFGGGSFRGAALGAPAMTAKKRAATIQRDAEPVEPDLCQMPHSLPLRVKHWA